MIKPAIFVIGNLLAIFSIMFGYVTIGAIFLLGANITPWLLQSHSQENS